MSYQLDGDVISVAVNISVMFIIKSFLGILTSMCAFLLEGHPSFPDLR